MSRPAALAPVMLLHRFPFQAAGGSEGMQAAGVAAPTESAGLGGGDGGENRLNCQ